MRPWGWLLALLLAEPAAGAPAPPSGEEAGLLDWARSADPLGDSFPRRPAPGDYSSSFGTILDTSCIRGLPTRQMLKAVNTWDADLSRAFALMRSCSRSYPELVGYLHDAVGILRRSVVTCRATAGEPSFQGGSGGYSVPVHYPGSPDRQGRNLYRPAAYERFYYIVIPDDLVRFNAYAKEYRAGTFFHEPFHFTGANNMADHNTLENVLYVSSSPCSRNRLDDRIMLIEALCGARPSENDGAHLVERMSRCGVERGCMAALTTVEPDYWNDTSAPHMYGRPFAEPEARLLCTRIRDREAVRNLASQRGKEALDRAYSARNALVEFEPAMAPRPPTPKLPVPQPWRLPPHYLAALPVEARASLAAAPDLEERLQSCRAGAGRVVDVASQPEGCPLSSADRLFPITEALAGYNNQEAVLFDGSEEVLIALIKNLYGAAPVDLDELLSRTERLYGEHCPASAATEGFYPPICHNGRTIVTEAIQAARRL